jgi:hypothetical protein
MTEHESTIGRELDQVLRDVQERSSLGRAFVSIVRREQIIRDAAFMEELQGVTHEDAVRLAQLEQEPDEGETDMAAAHFEHSGVLAKSGLAFSESGSLHIHIMDGGQFATTLQGIDRGTATDTLRTSLESVVYMNLHDVEDTALADHEEDVRRLFAPHDVPSWALAYRAPNSATPQETQAIAQTIAYMPGIAKGMEHIGVTDSRAIAAAHLDAIHKDGDLWRWALAGHMGFAPEIELPSSTGQVYDIMTEGKDWDVVVRMLRSARPGGAFVTVIGKRIEETISRQLSDLARQIDEPVDDYVKRETEIQNRMWEERPQDEEFDDLIDLRLDPEQLEGQYHADREYALRHMATLRAAATGVHDALRAG